VILERNCAALGIRFPELVALVASSESAVFDACPAASGAMSARLVCDARTAGAYLHSSRDPAAEAVKLAEACLGPGIDVALILGLGLGYGAEACLASGAERVVVCVANPGELKAAFSLCDLSAWLSDERLSFVVGGEAEGVISALELSGGSKAGILENRALVAASSDWYGRARAAAGRWNAKGAVNENTLRRFGRLWVRNLAANLEAASSSPGVEKLEGLFEGFPAIVLAAGPSLDPVLPRMREICERCLVVAVDTSLRSLLRYGIEPDFLVVVDPQYWNWRHLAGLSSPSSFLVSESAVWPVVFRSSRRGTFLGGSLFPLGRRIESFSGPKGHLGAGGSVATSAWDLCRIMGSSPIWMAGLDLSYPGGRTHAAASLFEQRALASGTRLDPASSSQASAFVGGTSFEAEAADGGRVRTDQRMSLYAWWFECRLARPSSPRTISLSRTGLAIPGLAVGSIDELLALSPRRQGLDERLGFAASLEHEGDGRGGAVAGLLSLRAALTSIELAARSGLEAARSGHAAFASGGDCGPYIVALEASDTAIMGIEERDVAGFLLPPLSELAGSKARDLGESFAQSEALYASVAESARYHLEVLPDLSTDKVRGNS
jgi:hypothetical protein